MNRDFIMNTIGSFNCSDSTKNRYLALMRAILNKAAKEWQWLDKVPTITMYREAKRRIRRLTRNEAQKLVAALPEYMADMAVFSLATGLRQRNVLELKWAKIDLGRKAAWIDADEAKAELSASRLIRRRSVCWKSKWADTRLLFLPMRTAAL